MTVHQALTEELRSQEAIRGLAGGLAAGLGAACAESGITNTHEYVTMVTADIEAISKYCETATKNSHSVARAAAPDQMGPAFKKRRAGVSTTALADVVNALRKS